MHSLSCAVLFSLIASSAGVGQTPAQAPMRIPRDTFVAWMSPSFKRGSVGRR